ncbi:MAG TPA: bifunctional methylenetetrahydrofolate dehydrogenase/methenyltetrahydrofolate cyclohydrolase FolD [Polyangiaceae bacterium]|nr:bifunctional methylenetetrahydrofolate dehydrogenase/methenyltetrahydrofolate cyclohydrolase FolD [Polyangiaceae bacterium]
MKLIDGKAIAQALRIDVASGVRRFLEAHSRVPALHVVLVGDDPASAVYVRNKEKAVLEAGMRGEVHRLPATTSAAELHALVDRLNRDPAVDGILVQLPLPKHIPVDPLLESVDPAKDVDGFHPVNVGRLWSGRNALVPCTPRGCLHLLRSAEIPLEGVRALVVGRSNIVGKPMAALLLGAHATVTLAHSRTRDLPARCREADVLIVAAGQPRLVEGSWIKPGATVIDVGMHRGADGKLCGDVDFASASGVAGAITPVPGGVGPMTIAMLLDNTLRAASLRENSR